MSNRKMTVKQSLKILGFPESLSKSELTKDQISKNYRRLCRTVHPDVNQATDANVRMTSLNLAKEVLDEWLSNPIPDNDEYMQNSGSNRQQDNYQSQSSSSYESFRFRRDGLDLTDIIILSDVEANQGCVIEIGSTSRKQKVRIPPGTRTGSTIRARGLGEPGTNGGNNGDLLISIIVNPPTTFRSQYSQSRSSESRTVTGYALYTDEDVRKGTWLLNVWSRPNNSGSLITSNADASAYRSNGLFISEGTYQFWDLETPHFMRSLTQPVMIVHLNWTSSARRASYFKLFKFRVAPWLAAGAVVFGIGAGIFGPKEGAVVTLILALSAAWLVFS